MCGIHYGPHELHYPKRALAGICGLAAAAWAREEEIIAVGPLFMGGHVEKEIIARPVRPSDCEIIVECLVLSLYHSKFSSPEDERHVALMLARKAAGPDESEAWEESCWRRGALYALLQRVIRGMFSSNLAQDIFDDDPESQTTFELLHQGPFRIPLCI